MRAYRYRLIFWPLFAGFVAFSLSGKRIEGPNWPVTTMATVTTLAAIFASDPNRGWSFATRIALLVAAFAAAGDLLTTQFVGDYDVTVLFFLAVFAIPLVKAALQKRRIPTPD